MPSQPEFTHLVCLALVDSVDKTENLFVDLLLNPHNLGESNARSNVESWPEWPQMCQGPCSLALNVAWIAIKESSRWEPASSTEAAYFCASAIRKQSECTWPFGTIVAYLFKLCEFFTNPLDYRVVVRFFLAKNYWCLSYARIELYQHEILRAKVNRQLFNQELHFDLQSSHSIIYDCNIVNGQVQSLYLQANQHNKNETL